MGGEQREFDSVRGPGLIEDVGQVGLDGVLGNRGAFGDLLVRATRHDRAQDVDLAARQPERFALPPRGVELPQARQDARYLLTDPEVTGPHTLNALEEDIGRGIPRHHAPGAKPHGADNIRAVDRVVRMITRTVTPDAASSRNVSTAGRPDFVSASRRISGSWVRTRLTAADSAPTPLTVRRADWASSRRRRPSRKIGGSPAITRRTGSASLFTSNGPVSSGRASHSTRPPLEHKSGRRAGFKTEGGIRL